MSGWSAAALYGAGFAYVFGRLLLCPLLLLAQARLPLRQIVRGTAYAPGQIRRELLQNLKVSFVEAVCLPSMAAFDLVAARPPTVATVAAGFAFTYVFFELWFYGMHRLFHTRRFMWIHKEHHRYRRTSPFSALALSVPEKLSNFTGMVLLPCAASFVLPLAFEGIVAYHVYNFLVNVLGHSNVEIMPRAYAESPPGRVFVTSTYHTLHHVHANRNFGLFTRVFDSLFGTAAEGYVEVYAGVTHDQGLPLRKQPARVVS